MEDATIADSALADYAEPLIKAKQALKDYEQAVLHGQWDEAIARGFEMSRYAQDMRIWAAAKTLRKIDDSKS